MYQFELPSTRYFTSDLYWQILETVYLKLEQYPRIQLDYIDAATTGTLSPHILLIKDLRQMLLYIEEALPLTMHLPVSSKETLHFYWYLCIHVFDCQ